MNKKYVSTKKIAWIGGAVLAGAGAIVFLSGGGVSENNIIGASLAVGGVAWTTIFLLVANSYKPDNYTNLSSAPIYQKDVHFSNGSSLSLGTDLLSDRTLGSNTIGLGLRYNF